MKANDRHSKVRSVRRETKLEQIQTELQQCKEFGWRGVVGSHRGSKTFQEIMRAIRRHRRDEYIKAS